MVGSACGRREHCAAAALTLRGAESIECGLSGQAGKGSCGWRGKMTEKDVEVCERSKQRQLGRQSMMKHRMGCSGDDEPGRVGWVHCRHPMPRAATEQRAASGEAAPSLQAGCKPEACELALEAAKPGLKEVAETWGLMSASSLDWGVEDVLRPAQLEQKSV